MTFKPVSTDDFAAISNMMGAYQHAVDSGDEETYSNLFTEDGAFIGMPLEYGPPEAFVGRTGVATIARISKQAASGTFRHFMGNFTVQYGATKDEAVAKYYALTSISVDGWQPLQMINLVTQLVKINGEWKIKTNTMTPVTPT